jgi:deoxyribodipyrimidine photolyase-related protein
MEAVEYEDAIFVEGLSAQLPVEVEVIPNDRFMVSRQAFADWYRSETDPTMERFYEMRRKETGLLMEEGIPVGGQWNYDAENRVPPAGNLPVPRVTRVRPR